MSRVALQLSPQQQGWLTVGAALVVAAVILRVALLPMASRVGERLSALRELRARIVEARQQAVELPAMEAASEAARSRYHRVEARLGNGQSVARILEELGQQARESSVELVAVQPRIEDEKQRQVTLESGLVMRAMPLQLQVTGRYRQLGEFLGRLPTSSFLASVETLKMSRPQAASPQLRAELGLTVYLAEPSPPS